jgi:hypothetical protein
MHKPGMAVRLPGNPPHATSCPVPTHKLATAGVPLEKIVQATENIIASRPTVAPAIPAPAPAQTPKPKLIGCPASALELQDFTPARHTADLGVEYDGTAFTVYLQPKAAASALADIAKALTKQPANYKVFKPRGLASGVIRYIVDVDPKGGKGIPPAALKRLVGELSV